VDGYRRFQRSQKVPARSRNGPGAVVSHNKSIGKNSELWCARGPAVTSGLSNLIRLTSRCVHSESVRQRGRARPDGPPRIFRLSLDQQQNFSLQLKHAAHRGCPTIHNRFRPAAVSIIAC